MRKFFANIFYKKLSIAIIPFKGIIGVRKSGINFEQYSKVIEDAFKLPKIAAVVLVINSPGGSPSQSELIFKKIRKLSEEKKVPVIAFIEDIAASGGYYIALSADDIISTENSIIGSIGVISQGFGFNKAIEKLGVERRVYTVGKNKSLLDPFSPEKPEDIEIIKEVQKDISENFSGVVIDRRKGKISDNEELFTGRIWSGKGALKLGLIDGNDDLDNYLETRFGKKINKIKMEPKKKGLLSRFGFGDVIGNMFEEFWWFR